jgi:tetratricopeptide (TPR) repeat protein
MTIDRSSWWWQRGRAMLAVVVALGLTGWVTGPLNQHVWGVLRERNPELSIRDMKSALGQGMVLGLLGGFRSIIADFVWIQAYSAWEAKDRPQTEALVDLATMLNPMSVYFWSHGADYIGKDIPYWRIRGADRQLNPVEQLAIRREQGERAQALLDRGLTYHPDNWRLLRDKAMIYQFNMSDFADSLEWYKKAAEAPGGPRYLPRVYADLLDQAGRKREAYDYLRALYPTLPPHVPAAAKDVVWERLRELEDELKLPAAERLPASEATLPDAAGPAAIPASTH